MKTLVLSILLLSIAICGKRTVQQVAGKYGSHDNYTMILTLKADSTYDYFCGTWDNIIRTKGTWHMYSNKGLILYNPDPQVKAVDVWIISADELRMGKVVFRREKK